MSENNSLNEKYQKFEAEEDIQEAVSEDIPEKKKKEKKVKMPKEKKVKAPKEKKRKVKKPKEQTFEQDLPEEKPSEEEVLTTEEETVSEYTENTTDIKEEEPFFEADFSDGTDSVIEPAKSEENVSQPQEENAPEEPEEPEEPEAPVPTGRHREEIVIELPAEPKKKIKKEKPIKEKAPKEPKEKKPKEPKEKKEKSPREPIGKKDIVTVLVSLVAVALLVCVGFFAYFVSRPDLQKIDIVSKHPFLGKIFPQYVIQLPSNENTQNIKQISDAQIARNGIFTNLVQTDFPRIFYGVNTDYSIQYYQYSDNTIVPVKYTDTVNLKVDMGSGILNVKMNYIKNGEYVSGISVFTADGNSGDTNYFYNLVAFKLTVLPTKYSKPGHALLLASTDKSVLSGNTNALWTESFDVNLDDGTTTRFLSVVNRTIDEKGAGVADFCILNKAGYTSSNPKIPFISSREYPIGSGHQDIFVKSGNTEERLASDVYGRYVAVDGMKTIYLRRNTTGFDVIHNINGEEKTAQSFIGFMDTNYAINDKYLLSKNDGHLYNIASGKDYSLVGYAMNVSSFTVSDDGRYVVMMGTVKNAIDYQIHIFDLQTGEYVKFQDKNFSVHETLCFIDNKTVLYTAYDPNQGYEYVIMDVEKAFAPAK